MAVDIDAREVLPIDAATVVAEDTVGGVAHEVHDGVVLAESDAARGLELGAAACQGGIRLVELDHDGSIAPASAAAPTSAR